MKLLSTLIKKAALVAVFGLFFSMPERALAFDIAQMEGHNESAKIAPILKEIYKGLGIEANFVLLPAARTLHQVDSGSLDGELLRIAGMERKYPNLVRVPTPLYAFSGNIGGLSEKCGKYKRLEDLRGVEVGLANGMVWAQKIAKDLRVKAVAKNDYANVLSGLVNGTFDCAFITSTAYENARKGMFSGFDLKIVFSELVIVEVFHYVHKRHEKLVPRLAEEIKKRYVKKGSLITD